MKVSGSPASAYRVSLPKDACKHLGIVPGDVLVVSVEDNELHLVKRGS